MSERTQTLQRELEQIRKLLDGNIKQLKSLNNNKTNIIEELLIASISLYEAEEQWKIRVNRTKNYIKKCEKDIKRNERELKDCKIDDVFSKYSIW